MTLRARRDADAAPAAATATVSARAGPAATLAAVLFGAVFLAVFLFRFPPAAAALGRVAEPAVAAGVVLLATFGTGALALHLAEAIFRRFAGLPLAGRPAAIEAPDGQAPRDQGVDVVAAESWTALLVGLPAFGTLVALLAWTGVAIQLLVSLVSLAMAAVGAAVLARRRPRLGAVTGLDVMLLGPPVAIALLGALAPVNSPDELVYKLAVPKAYLLFGGMIDLPLNSYSYASTALSHVSLAALALSGGIAAKLVHFAIFVGGLVTLRRLGDQLEAGAGTWVATVAAWTPALLLIAGWAWTEWGVLTLLLLSYRGWLELQRRPTAGAAAVITAALAGAAAIKYTALPWIAVFAVLAAMRLRSAVGRETEVHLGRLFTTAALVLLALGGFFYARNWTWSGSPVAPFLLEGAPAIERYRSQGALAGWQELLLGYDIVHRGIVDDALGILLPLCALLAAFGAFRDRAARDLFWIGLAPLPVLIALAPTSRLILGSVAPLAVVGAVHLARSWRAVESALLRGAVAALAGVALAVQLMLVLWILVTSHDPLGVVLGAETDQAYVARMRPYAAAYRWIEDNTPPQSRLLLVGENRSYALERAAFSAGNFDGDRMARFLGRRTDATAFAHDLRGLGVTHVVVHWPWLRVEGRTKGEPGMLEREFVLPLPQSTARMLQDLVDRVATRRYQDDAYSVYELPAADDSEREPGR
jgi:hypothetical protein